MATIRQKGKDQWHVQIRRKGWPWQTRTFKTRKHAQSWARRTEAQMDQGTFVDQSGARETTFGELIEQYIYNVTRHRPTEGARESEETRLRRILREEQRLCAHAAINLEPEHFEDYRDRRLSYRQANGKTIAPGTVKRELSILKRVIDYRKRALGLTMNPINNEDVKRPTVNDERDVRLSPQERARLLAACAAARNPYLGPIVEFAFETGARRSSILKLEWRDIDLQMGTALLRGIKNSRSPDKIINHQIGLTPRAAEILANLARTDTRIFPLTENALKHSFNRARKRAEVEHFNFHDTRHERTSSLFEAGWSMVQVMAQTGHRDPKSVKRYANLQGHFLAQELAKL